MAVSIRTALLGATVLAAALLAAPAAADATVTVQVRDSFTSHTELRGELRFTRPHGWSPTNESARHTVATFRTTVGPCPMRMSVSVRAKATRTSIRKQLRPETLGHGRRAGGLWATSGPLIPGGEGMPLQAGLYGIAPVRVHSRRYGQIRVFGTFERCDDEDPSALVTSRSRVVRQANHVLAKAQPRWRIVRVHR